MSKVQIHLPQPIESLQLRALSLPKPSKWWMIPLLLIPFALAVYGANADTFWFDEVGSLYYAGGIPDEGPKTFGELIESQVNEDLTEETNPPGYYIALFLWVSAVGTSEIAVRMLSVFASLIAIALVYRTGRDIRNVELGLAAAVLLGMCAFYVYYMHEARSYGLYSLFIALSVWAYHRLTTQEQNPPGVYVLLGISIVGLLYIHYLATMFIISAGLYHLVFTRKNKTWWRITITVIVAGLLFVPWFQLALRSFGHVSGDGSRELFALSFFGLFWELFTQFGNYSPLVAVILLLAAITNGNRLTWFLLAGTLLLTAAANERVKFISDAHYLMAVFPLLALVAAQGVMRFRTWGVLIVGIWAVAGVWFTLQPPPSEDDAWEISLRWKAIASLVGNPIQTDDTVIFHLPDPDPTWIHERSADYYVPQLDEGVRLVESYTYVPQKQHIDNLSNYIERENRFWLIQDMEAQPSTIGIIERDRLFTQLRAAYCHVELYEDSVRARLYQLVPELEEIPEFENGLRVGLAEWQPRDLGSHNYEFMLATAAKKDVDTSRVIVVAQVLDESGAPVAEYPTRFPSEQHGCVHVSIDKSQIAAGTYTVQLVMWDTVDEAEIAPIATEGDPYLPLFTFEVTE